MDGTTCCRGREEVFGFAVRMESMALSQEPLAAALRGEEAAMDDWPFEDPKNVAAITVRQVAHGDEPILLVARDADDGMWQFLPGGPVEESDAMVVSLAMVYRIDPSIGQLADLPLGWTAERSAPGEPWKRSPG